MYRLLSFNPETKETKIVYENFSPLFGVAIGPDDADKAFISLSTVKAHINSIFRKLDVQSRLQAILKAKDLLQPQLK